MNRDSDLWLDDDTIAALSTPAGIGGLGVVRVSGLRALDVVRACVADLSWNPRPRRAGLVELVAAGNSLDRSLVTFFPGPRSYTGEDVVEISLHGSPILADRLLDALCTAGARRALPGEFTLRAFRSGRIDLIQAEAVNSLINARSEEGARLAFSSMEGALSDKMNRLRSRMIELGAALETEIEFAEDQHMDAIPALEAVRSARDEIGVILEQARFNEVLRRGLEVVIAGRVNAGKSTLFNSLLANDRALVSSRPGTTRDFLTGTIYIDGFPVDLTDVAGWDNLSRDDLESRGIRRGVERLAEGDVVLLLMDASRPLNDADEEMDRMTAGYDRLVVATKMDRSDPDVLEQLRRRYADEPYCEVSALEVPALPDIRNFLRNRVRNLTRRENDFAVSARQRELLRELRDRLGRICEGLESGNPEVELLAEELRRGLDCVGRLTGGITTGDILTEVFSRFCIGK